MSRLTDERVTPELVNRAIIDIAECNRVSLSRSIVLSRIWQVQEERRRLNDAFDLHLYQRRLQNLHRSDWRTE